MLVENVRAELGLTPGECDDFFKQDGEIGRPQYYEYNPQRLALIYFYRVNEAQREKVYIFNGVAGLVQYAGKITDQDVQDYAARNGLDWAKRAPVPPPEA